MRAKKKFVDLKWASRCWISIQNFIFPDRKVFLVLGGRLVWPWGWGAGVHQISPPPPPPLRVDQHIAGAMGQQQVAALPGHVVACKRPQAVHDASAFGVARLEPPPRCRVAAPAPRPESAPRRLHRWGHVLLQIGMSQAMRNAAHAPVGSAAKWDDLGEFRLRGVPDPVRIHQALPVLLADRTFPPLRVEVEGDDDEEADHATEVGDGVSVAPSLRMGREISRHPLVRSGKVSTEVCVRACHVLRCAVPCRAVCADVCLCVCARACVCLFSRLSTHVSVRPRAGVRVCMCAFTCACVAYVANMRYQSFHRVHSKWVEGRPSHRRARCESLSSHSSWHSAYTPPSTVCHALHALLQYSEPSQVLLCRKNVRPHSTPPPPALYKLRRCPSYSRRRDRNNCVHWRNLYRGGGVILESIIA